MSVFNHIPDDTHLFHGLLLVYYRHGSNIHWKSQPMWTESRFPTSEVRFLLSMSYQLLVKHGRLAPDHLVHSSTPSAMIPLSTYSLSFGQ